MNTRAEPRWELVREIGLEYAAGDEVQCAADLRWPVVAECIPGLGYLIVDELPVYSIPLRTNCRTLLLSESREVVYDSKAHGIDDGYGCRMDGEHFAILRRTRREILVLSRLGECIRRIDLSPISRHQPRTHCWTHRGTFLVSFLTLGQPFDIVEVDIHGRVFWSLAGSSGAVGISASMQLLANNSILIANEGSHVVQELRRDGSTAIRWGKWDLPSAAYGHLSNPKWAQQLDDGTLLIADANNHRCLAIDPAGRVSDIQPRDRSFFVPSFVTRLQNDNYLICDAGLRCIFELDRTSQIVWQMGATLARKRHFSFPRSVQYLGSGQYLIADTAHNRIVEFDGQRLRECTVNGGGKLFWPRAARRTHYGTLLVADGRNFRVLELSSEGDVLRQLDHVRFEGRSIELQDPHDIRLLPNQNLLITDAAGNLVFETDWNGRAAWVVGLDGDLAVNDPHSAQLIPDGRVMIADSNNHRILFVNPRTRVSHSMTEFPFGVSGRQLNYPRYAELADDGALVIVDTSNNRVLGTDLSGALLWELSQVPESPVPYLHFPRWAHLIDRDELVISDHFNHRILHLRRQIDSPMAGST